MIFDLPPSQNLPFPVVQISEISLPAQAEAATYDAEKRVATIRISDAFPLARQIKNYHGKYVTLIYRGHFTQPQNCPVVVVPLSRVERDFPNIFKDTVTLRISSVSQRVADMIEKAKCLNVDTETVRAIINRPSPQHNEIPN